MTDEPKLEPGATTVNPEASELDPAVVERRELLRRFGKFAAFTAPAMTVLMASRQSEAGSFFRNKAHHGRNGGKDGGAGGGGGAAEEVAASPAEVWVSCPEMLAAGASPRPTSSGTPLPAAGDGAESRGAGAADGLHSS